MTADHSIEYSEGKDQDDILLKPTGRLDRAELRAIPLGAHILMCTASREGVEFSGYVYNEEMRDSWIGELPDEEAAFESSTVFWVDPARIKDVPDTEGLLSPEQIANKRLTENYVDEEGVYEAIENQTLDPNGIRAMLVQAVKDARVGLVRNPF